MVGMCAVDWREVTNRLEAITASVRENGAACKTQSFYGEQVDEPLIT